MPRVYPDKYILGIISNEFKGLLVIWRKTILLLYWQKCFRFLPLPRRVFPSPGAAHVEDACPDFTAGGRRPPCTCVTPSLEHSTFGRDHLCLRHVNCDPAEDGDHAIAAGTSRAPGVGRPPADSRWS